MLVYKKENILKLSLNDFDFGKKILSQKSGEINYVWEGKKKVANFVQNDKTGWIVAELGRQPWVIQDILPTTAAVSRIGVGAVQVTFFLFLIIFTTLLIAELKILFKQIKLGPKEGGN